MSPQVKQLGGASLEKVKSLEDKTGTVIVAWSRDPKPASLSEDQIKELQSLESELDAVLVAYGS